MTESQPVDDGFCVACGPLSTIGLKLTFALLCRPDLVCKDYRTIATNAGVALGTVGADMKDLKARGFFNLETHPHLRKLLDPKRMLEEWVTHYPITLRPKLNLGRFRADPERLQHTALAPLNAYWGAEPAAEKLTRYLKPAHFTIYTGEPIARLVAAGRMRAEAAGNVEILEKFWKFPTAHADKNDAPDVVPPILAYASKWDPASPFATQISYRRAVLPADAEHRLTYQALRLFERLGCRDYARFDFRADARGQVKLLEVNPNPGWCWDGKLNIMASFAGLRYPDLLRLILQAAEHRLSLCHGGTLASIRDLSKRKRDSRTNVSKAIPTPVGKARRTG